ATAKAVFHMKLSHLPLLFLLLASRSPAQVRIVGAISGVITDASGASVPGAKVMLKDEGTAIAREGTTTASGTFFFPDQAHGLYQITVTAAGFQSAVINHVEVAASQTTDVPIRLTVGQQAETVTVEGVAPVLESTSQLVATTQTTRLVNELP